MIIDMAMVVKLPSEMFAELYRLERNLTCFA